MPQPGDPAAAKELLRAARGQAVAQRWRDAARLFAQAVDADPSLQAARLEYGWFLLEPSTEQNQGEALRQFRYARLLDEHSAEATAGEGVARVVVGDLARAEPLLLRCAGSAELMDRPSIQADVHAALAELYVQTGRGARAGAHFEEALACLPAREHPRDRARVLAGYASWLADEQCLAESEKLLREAVALDPKQLEAHYQLSRLLRRSGRIEEAEREQRIHEVLRQLFDHTSRVFLEDHDRRVALHRELMEAYPEFRRARFELIRVLLEVERYDECLKEIATASREVGFTGEVFYLVARAKAGKGDLGGAREAHDRMREATPEAPAEVTRDILDQWRKSHPVDAELYERTLRQWLGS